MRQCKDLLDELLREPSPRRLFMARNQRRYRSVELCRFALAEGFACRFEDASKLLECSEIGAAIADALGPADGGRDEVSAIRAEAYGYLGNALRVSNRFREARAALGKAKAELGPGAPLLLVARLLEFEASYLDSVRDLEGALCVLNQVVKIYRRCGSDRLPSALVQVAIAEGYLGRPERAVRLLRDIEPQVHTRHLAMSFLSALSVNLLEAGFPHEAEATLYELRKLAPGEPLVQLRLLWTDARIKAHTGSYLLAEQQFCEVRKSFEKREMFYESALAGIEHALALAMGGATVLARPILVGVRSMLGALGVRREALAAELLEQALVTGCERAAVLRALLALRTMPPITAEPTASTS